MSETVVDVYLADPTHKRLFVREYACEQLCNLFAARLRDQNATCAGLARQLGWGRARVQRVLDGAGTVP